MNALTVCVPINVDGTIHPLLGQAPRVATCHVNGGIVSDWTEHAVDWDNNYGVDVLGVHHPRVIRFLIDHDVDTVVADDVCPGVQRVLTTRGVTLHSQVTGDARSAVAAMGAAA
jgi:predicted Fe-Mo cluster-binding NifX family protein